MSSAAVLDRPRTRTAAADPLPVGAFEADPDETFADAGRPFTAGDLPELLDRLGGVDPGRVWMTPAPGTATAEDAEFFHDRGYLVELIDGTLVEKAMSDWTGYLAGLIVTRLNNFVLDRSLGVCHTADGFFHFGPLLRAPDASFTPKTRRRGPLLRRGYSDVPPALVVEVISPRNTRAEMARKRGTYFSHDVLLVWEFDEDAAGPLVRIYEGPDGPSATLRPGETLTGGAVLPGFRAAVDELFADPLADGAEAPGEAPAERSPPAAE